MAELAFCFREVSEIRNLTKSEINDITMAAQGVHAIIKVMNKYAINHPQGEDDDSIGIYSSVFNILDLLMEPISDYLFEYAGHGSGTRRKNRIGREHSGAGMAPETIKQQGAKNENRS